MTTFLKWVEKMRFSEDIEDSQNPSDRFKLNNGDDLGNDYDHTLQELMKIVMSKYERETMQFLDGIAQRGDREISNLLRKLGKETQPSSMREPEHPTQGDEVVPSNADVGSSEQGGDGE